MPWAPLTPSQPLRPLPVLWLLVPWIGGVAAVASWSYLASSALDELVTALDPGARAAASGVASSGALCIGQLGLAPPWVTALAVALTWGWMAIAVPGHRRPWLWLAAALLATHAALAVATGAGAPLCALPPAAVVGLPYAAAAAAIAAIFVAAAQGAADRGRRAARGV